MRADIVASNFDDVSWRQTGAKRRCLTVDSDGVCRDEIVGFAPRDAKLDREKLIEANRFGATS